MTSLQRAAGQAGSPIDSAAAWLRLAVAVLLSTVGGVGMWSVMVALPAIQTDFGVSRADASLPFTMVMIGFAGGGILMGRLADRFGIAVPLAIGTLALSAGYLATGWSSSLWQVALAHGADRDRLLGEFRPADGRHLALVRAPTRHRRRDRRRPEIISPARSGRRWCSISLPPTAGARPISASACSASSPCCRWCSLLRRRIEDHHSDAAGAAAARRQAEMPFSPLTLQVLLCIAGVGCCVAMSMPQVHIVAYCGDLGYGVARGAEMLSLMLGFGIISRIASGFIADRIGGVRTLLLGSVLQGAALFLYLWFDGLVSLYVISALFGLFQGGIVPSYAIIVREYFSPREAGTRARPRLDGDAARHGAGRLDVGLDLRPHRLLPGGVPERPRLESGERVDHDLAAAALAQQRETGGGLKCVRALAISAHSRESGNPVLENL